MSNQTVSFTEEKGQARKEVMTSLRPHNFSVVRPKWNVEERATLQDGSRKVRWKKVLGQRSKRKIYHKDS